MTTRFSRSMVAAFLALIGVSAAEAASSWSFTAGGNESGTGNFGNTRSYAGAGDGGNVTISAWSNTKNNTSGTQNAYIESAYLGTYSGGLGVTNRDAGSTAGDTYEGTIQNSTSPGHTMDNSARYDSMLFDFGAGASAALKTVTVGWWKTDSDLTVLAYTGSGTPTFLSADVGYSTLLSNGWSVVKASNSAHYTNAANGGVSQSSDVAGYKPLTVNDLNISSRYWLVGALNTLVQSLPSADTSKDFIKIAGVTADYGQVSEPASVVLAGGGLLGLLALRRRRH
ncbi:MULTISPECIES: exosortase-dependent surface protein XDP1 [Zoogloeaceae]|jgi:hypothetical protein|nr:MULTISPECIES: exosortase-dependent surface protein XDP1 [Zoogloeaceae]MBK6654705.1 PEP-CTERM sorting domain-containing protein [Zoogloea sp.]MBP7445871.1 PEP-CTERM sorting domain-containing protein [Zoogloea sp.]